MYKADFEAMKWEKPLKGMQCKRVLHHGRQLRLVEYTPEMEPHWCDKGHVGMVLSGEMEIEFPDDTIHYKTGDGVFLPAGWDHRHRARILTDTVRVIFVEDR